MHDLHKLLRENVDEAYELIETFHNKELEFFEIDWDYINANGKLKTRDLQDLKNEGIEYCPFVRIMSQEDYRLFDALILKIYKDATGAMGIYYVEVKNINTHSINNRVEEGDFNDAFGLDRQLIIDMMLTDEKEH